MSRTRVGLLVALASAVVMGGCTQEAPKTPMIRIGAIMPLTGDYAPYGARSLKAARLGLQDGGLVEGRSYSLAVEDDAADAKRSVSAASKLLNVDGVDFVIGPFASGSTIAVAPLIRDKPVIVISPASTAPSISGLAPNLYRTCPSDTAEANVVATTMHAAGIATATVLYIQNDYGVQLKTAFERTFAGLGGRVMMSDAFAPGTKDFRTLVAKVLNNKAGAVYLIGYDELQGLVRSLVQEARMGPVPVYANVMLNNPAILSVLRQCDACKAWRISFPVWTPDSAEAAAAMKSFEARLGEQSDPFAVNSYNAGRVIAAAVAAAPNGGFERWSQYLRTARFTSLTGTLSFDKNGDVVLPVRMVEVFK